MWLYFCPATSSQAKYASAQIIGYHEKTGATCFCEANEKNFDQSKWQVFENNKLSGILAFTQISCPIYRPAA